MDNNWRKKWDNQADAVFLLTTNALTLCSFFSFPDRIKETARETQHKQNNESEIE
jgi:hypothetical protein